MFWRSVCFAKACFVFSYGLKISSNKNHCSAAYFFGSAVSEASLAFFFVARYGLD